MLDPSAGLYDIAFVIHAHIWYCRASGDLEALARGRKAFDFVQPKMRLAEGFAHALPMTGPSVQNPHMHFLEACIAAFEVTQD